MADFVFNIAKGRVVEYYNRVKGNDPSTSVLWLIPCSASDTEANAQDADTLTAALATAINEQTSGNWSRKQLTDSLLAALPAPDDTNNDYSVPLPSVTWSGPAPTAGNNTTGLIVGYEALGAGTDANIIPLTFHDFVVTADGNDVVLNAGDFFDAA